MPARRGQDSGGAEASRSTVEEEKNKTALVLFSQPNHCLWPFGVSAALSPSLQTLLPRVGHGLQWGDRRAGGLPRGHRRKPAPSSPGSCTRIGWASLPFPSPPSTLFPRFSERGPVSRF